jgi:hypothetical protein
MTVSSVWLQALLTVGVALVVSLVSLLYRYRQKVHTFGSLTAAKWAIFVVVVTAAPAGLALLLPRVPPAYLGMAVPAVLVVRGDRLHERRKPTQDAGWYRVATLGVRLLLDRLEQQMETDRDNWVKNYIDGLAGEGLAGEGLARDRLVRDRLADMERFAESAENLYSTLESRTSMRPYLNRLRSHRDAVRAATKEAQAAAERMPYHASERESREYRQAVHSAKRALTIMLQLAYDGGHQSAARIALSPATVSLTG